MTHGLSHSVSGTSNVSLSGVQTVADTDDVGNADNADNAGSADSIDSISNTPDFGPPALVDLSRYHQPGFDAGRPKWYIMLWWLVQAIVFPLTPHALHGPRCALLRWFGAKIGKHVVIRPSARFTYPWKVDIGDHSWVGEGVTFYSLAPIFLGQHCVVSQKSYLCTGSHNVSDPRFSLETAPIVIENGAWVATDCFVAPGVRIGANTVIGARSSVFKDMPADHICMGSPCCPKKPRTVAVE